MDYNNTHTTPVKDIELNTLEQLVDAVGADPGLAPEEQETLTGTANPDGMVHLYTAQPGVVRRSLRHPLFEVYRFGVYNGSFWTVDQASTSQGLVWSGFRDGSSWTGTLDEVARSDGRITAVWGYYPRGTFKIQSDSRSSSAAHKIVSKEERILFPRDKNHPDNPANQDEEASS